MCVPCGHAGELCCDAPDDTGSCLDASTACSLGADPFVPSAGAIYGLARVCARGDNVTDQAGVSDEPRRTNKQTGAMQWRDSPAPQLEAAAAWPYELDTLFGMSMFFWEVQRAGSLPADTRPPWRGDFKGQSPEADGGYFDAGDHNVFQLPHAYAVARLAWSTHRYWQGLAQSYFDGEANDKWSRDAVKWGADFFASTTDENRVLLHIGDIQKDHAYIGRSEMYPPIDRNVVYCEFGQCSDVAGEIAATLAHSAIVFQKDSVLRDEYWSKAKMAYAQTGVGTDTYTNSNDAYPLLAVYYASSGVVSHVLFGAASMYTACIALACGDEQTYLDDVMRLGSMDEPGGQKKWYWPVPSWDHAWFEAALVMLGHGIEGPEIYGQPSFPAFTGDMVKAWVDGTEPVQVSPRGQRWVDAWGSNRLATNGAALLLVWADLPASAQMGGITPQQARCTAMKQIHYMAGDNDREGSYVVGFGTNAPRRNHHRNSVCLPWEQNDDPAIACGPVFADVVDPRGSCPTFEDESAGVCYQAANRDNPLQTHGALLGGPKTPTDAGDPYRVPYSTEGWNDWRTDHVGSEQAMDYNALFTLALAAAIELEPEFWSEACGSGVDALPAQVGRGASDRTAETFADEDVWTFTDFEKYGWTRTSGFVNA